MFFLFTFECEMEIHSQPSVCTGVGYRICTACISTNVQYENEEKSSQNPELKKIQGLNLFVIQFGTGITGSSRFCQMPGLFL